jgi:APA family basic amino acid/polyamine antiporter
VIGVVIVTLCYVALNAAYLYVLPIDRVAVSTRIAADAADVLVGRSGAAAMSALVVFSTFGALNGIILTGPRVYFAMARDGLLFRWVAGIHPRFDTPHRAIVLQAVWSSVLVATGTYRQLFTRVIYTEWIFFALMAVGLVLLRRRPGYSPDYRTWGYPFVPAAFAIASLVIVANQIATDPMESASGLLLVAAGLPVYAIWLRGRSAGDVKR